MFFSLFCWILGIDDLFPQYKEEYDDECSFDSGGRSKKRKDSNFDGKGY
jgi:hypothetical protein